MRKTIGFILVVVCIVIFFDLSAKEESVKTDCDNSVNSDTVNYDYTDNELYSPLAGKVICIDAGHGISSIKKLEPIAPNCSEKKAAFVSGTSGSIMTEEQVNLLVALKLEQSLIDAGADVVMTRRTAECDLSNIDRAELANDAKADLTVRIHADGSENSDISGVSVLIPSDDYITNDGMLRKSRKAGELILNEVTEATGALNRGIVKRSDMTGFNWSNVPVVLLEMGFMTNHDEDVLLSSDDYQNKIVDGIMKGLDIYFNEVEEDTL